MSNSTQQAPIGFPEVVESKGLKAGALGLVSSVVVGMASTAPAYSLAASLGFVVATTNGDGIVGVKAPAIMLLAFVPMFLIAIAYQQLNKAGRTAEQRSRGPAGRLGRGPGGSAAGASSPPTSSSWRTWRRSRARTASS